MSPAPAPLGFDPASMFGDVVDLGYGVLRFTPYRISLEDVSGQGERRIVWRAHSDGAGVCGRVTR